MWKLNFEHSLNILQLVSHPYIGKLASYTYLKPCLTQLCRSQHPSVPGSHPPDTCNNAGEEWFWDGSFPHDTTAAGPPCFPTEGSGLQLSRFTPEPLQHQCPDLWGRTSWVFTSKGSSPTATVWQEAAQASQSILTTAREAINGIYRRIKGYLQNYTFLGNEVAFAIHCAKWINEDQLASNIKCILNKKEGEVERPA